MSNHVKAIIAAVLPLLVLYELYVRTGHIDGQEWALPILALASLLVEGASNIGPGVRGYLKGLIALLTPVVAAVVTGLFLGNWGEFEWGLMGLAVAQGFLALLASDAPHSTAPKSDPSNPA